MSPRDIARAAKPGWDNRARTGLRRPIHILRAADCDLGLCRKRSARLDRPETGQIDIEKYVEVHDAGLLASGLADAVKGGLVQGLGGGLLEELAYDDQGQLLTGSLADYLLPTASDVPPIEVIHMETPSPLNAFGVKGRRRRHRATGSNRKCRLRRAAPVQGGVELYTRALGRCGKCFDGLRPDAG